MKPLGNSWDVLLQEESRKPYYLSLRQFLLEEYSSKAIYPAMKDIFTVFAAVPPEKVRVVILGQDPYHGKGQAHGLSFSVLPGVPKPPSLKNIFKELSGDLGCREPESGCLLPWTAQGVFLMNTVLTVEEGRPGSHRGRGWETLTDRVVEALSKDSAPKAFLLWGQDARSKKALISNPAHLILETVHPSPLSAHRGFLGCGHFSKANDFLRAAGRGEVDWCAL